ncbi:MAG TPA: ATP-binding protein [Opitutaceae bacterium]|nr:ATP-binding protein [Opitutaceae bacterium]
MNPQLARQIKDFLPQADLEIQPWKGLFASISATYDQFDSEHKYLTHTLKATAAELTTANEELRSHSEHQLKSLSRYYQQTLELQQGMILCFRKTDAGFQHTLCRGQLATRLGWAPSEVEGKLSSELFPPEQLGTVENAYARAWRGIACSFEARSVDGEIFYLCLLRPLRQEGQVREVIVSAVEITALKHLEIDLRQEKEKAESADRAKSEFLAVMSHEIRTPLNAILGFAQLLRDSQLDDEQRSWLSIIAASGESLRGLIDDILDFSKIEAGMLELHEEPVVLQELLESITSMFRPRISEKGLDLNVRVAPHVPEAITTDANRLRQILVNLINNAVKFTEDGSITIEVSVIESPPTPEKGTWFLRFEIRDTGVGIKPEHRERMFKPFSQADSSTTRVYGGTGLGLAICKRLANALGGDVDFTSEFGRGSAFFFTVRAHATNLTVTSASMFSRATLSRLPKLRVLVVEDHATNRFLLRQIFRRFGYEADFAENGREAVITAAATDYDLILMDLQLPEMDGIEAAAEIRASRHGRPQPRIIALTASTLHEQHDRCMEAGMDGVLTKPIRMEALFSELARTTPLKAV